MLLTAPAAASDADWRKDRRFIVPASQSIIVEGALSEQVLTLGECDQVVSRGGYHSRSSPPGKTMPSNRSAGRFLASTWNPDSSDAPDAKESVAPGIGRHNRLIGRFFATIHKGTFERRVLPGGEPRHSFKS